MDYIIQALKELGWRYRIIQDNVVYLIDYRAVICINPSRYGTNNIYYGDSVYTFHSIAQHLDEGIIADVVKHELQHMMQDLILRENKL